jgi:hypothetical protein
MVLLVKTSDVVKYTTLSGLLDTDKFLQYIAIAQDIHIENYLGSALLEKLQNDIQNNTLSGNYLMLVNKYITPMLIHWAMVEYLPFAPYQIANKGVFKHSTENGDTIDSFGLNKLIDKEKDSAQLYTQRFIDYINANSGLFPEYNTYVNGRVQKDCDQDYFGWVL